MISFSRDDNDNPVGLEHFVHLGRQFQNLRQGNDIKSLARDSYEVQKRFSEPSASACSERWFLDHMDPEQMEHFRDWALVNSTCRGLRAWEKRVLAGKTSITRPSFLDDLYGTVAKSICAENARSGAGLHPSCH